MTQQALTQVVETPLPTITPHPTSCEELEGVCLELAFDGENCTYGGPTELNPGPGTFLFFNESSEGALANLVGHAKDKTVQDMIDYIGEEHEHGPAWMLGLGAYGYALSGKSHIWRGVLHPGIHTMVCLSDIPRADYFGAGLTVEE